MKGLNLQKKAVSIVAIILFGALAVNTAVLTYVASAKFKIAILGRTSAVGESLQRELGKVLGLGVPVESLEGVSEKLKDLTSVNKAISYAMVTDTNAKVLFHSDAGQVGKELLDKPSRSAASSATALIQTMGAYFDLSFPLLTADGKVTGTLRLGVMKTAINSQLYTLLLWALGISVLCFVLAIGLVSSFISRVITRPILAIETAADRIASGDLSAEVEVKGQDEIASLGHAINRMSNNLKDVLSKIGGITKSVSNVTAKIAGASQGVLAATEIQKKAVEETASAIEEMDSSVVRVATISNSLAVSAADTSSSVLQLSVSIERIAENSNVFSETAHETASSIEEMISSIKNIAGSIENLSSSAEAIASSIDEVNATTKDIENRAKESVRLAEAVVTNASEKGISSADAATAGMENIKKSVVALADVINLLGKRTDDIGKILNVIDDVADQTNLLALNAAILASKAGEHGKGFSIVADEIKNLAERASVSTSEIAALIKSVQEVTKSSIRLASDGIQTVEKGLTLVANMNVALREIADSSQASTEMAKAIQRATAEEAGVIKQITGSIEGMTEQTENISRAIQEQGKGSRFIIEATERVKDLSRQVKTATGEQTEGSRQIAGVIENVTHQTSQISDAINKQKEKSALIVHSMEKIHDATGNLSESALQMGAVISALQEEAMHLQEEIKKFKV